MSSQAWLLCAVVAVLVGLIPVSSTMIIWLGGKWIRPGVCVLIIDALGWIALCASAIAYAAANHRL